MVRIAVIGAGSMVFAKNIISDILSFSELSDSEFHLMDVDEHRLEKTKVATEAMIEIEELHATVEATTNRREALADSDYVLNMINVGGTEPFENEIRIPQQYGVDQAIGDTLGPGGVFRALRTLPTMFNIGADMTELCPDAPLLNYTNPMAPLCWAMHEQTDVETIGICHSVPNTVEAIAEYVDAPVEDLEYWVAGINHMAWFLDCTWDGEAVYPMLHDAMTDPDVYRRDTVRFELMRHFGAFVTESSNHLSEYLPYFRTRPETIEAMTGTDHAGRMETATYLRGWKTRSDERDDPESLFTPDDLVVERSNEYAARIIHSMETGRQRRMNLNVSNEFGSISNLPNDACVEVPCLVDGTGLHPCTVGDLPPQLAALNRTSINVQSLTVNAALEHDREAVYQAVKLDPLTSAVLTLDEAEEMTTELLEANSAYLPEFS